MKTTAWVMGGVLVVSMPAVGRGVVVPSDVIASEMSGTDAEAAGPTDRERVAVDKLIRDEKRLATVLDDLQRDKDALARARRPVDSSPSMPSPAPSSHDR